MQRANIHFQGKDVITIIFCVFLSFTQIKVFMPFVNSLIVMLLGVMFTLIYARRFYQQLYLIWLAIYFVILVMNSLFGDYYFNKLTNVVEEICILALPLALAYYIISYNKIKMGLYLLYAFMFLIIYSTITTYLVVLVSPDALRYSVYLSNENETETLNYLYGLGMVAYRFPHALPAFIPVLVYIIKDYRGKIGEKYTFMRLTAFITLFFLMFLIYLSNATTALLVAILVLLSSFFVVRKNNKINRPIILLFSVLFIPFVINSDWLVGILNYFGDLLGLDTSYINRLEEIKDYSRSGTAGGDLGARMDKYGISFSRFIENPIFGTEKSTGTHSAIFDRLACLGLVGWLPYIIYIFISIKKQGRMLSQKVLYYYYIGVTAAILILATKNMSNWDTWFIAFCLLPVSLWVVYNKAQSVDAD